MIYGKNQTQKSRATPHLSCAIPNPTTGQFLCFRFHLATPKNGSDTLLVCLLKKKTTNYMVEIFFNLLDFQRYPILLLLKGV